MHDTQGVVDEQQRRRPPTWLLPFLLIGSYAPLAALVLTGRALVVSLVLCAAALVAILVFELRERRRRRGGGAPSRTPDRERQGDS